MTGEELRALELSETEAVKDFVAAAPGAVVDALGIQARIIGSSLCLLCPGMPKVAVLNRVLGTGVSVPASDDEMSDVFAVARERDLTVQLAPFAHPPALHDRARAEGLVEASRWTRFARRLYEPPEDCPTDLTIDLPTPDDAERYASIVCEAFGLLPAAVPWIAALVGRPRWACVVARSADVVVAGGALFVEGDNAWLGLMATAPEARRQGAQRALLMRRLRLAARAGARLASIETGSPRPQGPGPSYRNIVRSGFEAVYERANLRLTAPR